MWRDVKKFEDHVKFKAFIEAVDDWIYHSKRLLEYFGTFNSIEDIDRGNDEIAKVFCKNCSSAYRLKQDFEFVHESWRSSLPRINSKYKELIDYLSGVYETIPEECPELITKWAWYYKEHIEKGMIY